MRHRRLVVLRVDHQILVRAELVVVRVEVVVQVKALQQPRLSSTA